MFIEAGHHRHPFGIYSFGHFHRLFTRLYKGILEFLFAGRQRDFPIVSSLHNKDAHGHTKAGQCLSNLFLLGLTSTEHTVVFHGAKTLVIHELDLIYKISSRMALKHPIVGCIVKFEWLAGGHILREACPRQPF